MWSCIVSHASDLFDKEAGVWPRLSSTLHDTVSILNRRSCSERDLSKVAPAAKATEGVTRMVSFTAALWDGRSRTVEDFSRGLFWLVESIFKSTGTENRKFELPKNEEKTILRRRRWVAGRGTVAKMTKFEIARWSFIKSWTSGQLIPGTRRDERFMERRSDIGVIRR